MRVLKVKLTSLICSAAILPVWAGASEPAATPRGPTNNILLIIADDVGNDKVGVYGEGDDRTRPRTPQIDGLAARGVRFVNAYANPYCSPTRATLLSGQYSFRNGIGSWIRYGGSAMLPLEVISIPELLDLGGSGYDHSHVGKWHLAARAVGGARNPLDQGFNWSAGAPANLGDYYHWIKQVNGATSWRNTYVTVDTTDDAIARANEMSEPWFLWLAYNAAHLPVHYPPPHLNRRPGTDGDDLHQYASVVEALDTELGRLFASVDPKRMANTTIIFLGDNGSAPEVTVRPYDPGLAKGTVAEGGINVPFIVAGPLVPPESRGRVSDLLVNTTDVFSTVAEIAGVDLEQVLPPDYPLDSVSLIPWLIDPDRREGARRFAYAEVFEPNGPGPYRFNNRAIRDGRWKLNRRVRNDREPPWIRDLLFDLDQAPPGINGEDLCPCPENLDAEALAAYERLVKALEEIGGP